MCDLSKNDFLFQKKIIFKAKYICDLLPLHISIVCSFVDIVFSTMFKELCKSLCQLATKLTDVKMFNFILAFFWKIESFRREHFKVMI